MIDLIESTNDWSIPGLVGLQHEVGELVLGYPVIGSDTDLPKLRNDFHSVLLAVGQLPYPEPRQRIVSLLEQYAFSFPTIVSPHAIVSRHSKLGPGTTVGHGVVVNAGATIGRHCILNNLSLIEHDAQIGDFCHVSTGALVNGGVCIGSGSFIGSGSMLREYLELPPRTIISAGKSVMGWPLKDQ